MVPRSFHRLIVSVPGCFILAALVLSFATTVSAQLGGTGIDDDRSSGMRQGANTIVGQVLFPPGYQPNRRCTIRLSSVRVGEFSTMTDDNGIFTFRRLREGSYFLIVEAGKDFLPAQETVDLFDNRPRTTNVQIELHLRPNLTPRPGVVDAALVGIPKEAGDLYRQAMSALSSGDTRKAIAQLKRAIEIHPQFVIALNELSGLYITEKDLKGAEEVLIAGLKYEPNNATLHVNYGYVLLLQEKFAEAEREFYRAEQLKDDAALAHLYRGRVLIRLQKLADAEAELLKTITLGGDPRILAYRYLGALYSETGEKLKAIEALETYLKLRPNAKDAEELKKIISELRQSVSDKKTN